MFTESNQLLYFTQLQAVTPMSFLQRLAACQDWESFTAIVTGLRGKMDLNFIRQAVVHKLVDFPTNFLDNR